MTTDRYADVFADKQRIMTVFAHPDDLEITCGGLIARLRADGKTVRTVCVTAGERGTRNRARDQDAFRVERLRAQELSALALGVEQSEIINLELGDGGVEDSLLTIERIVYQIRQYRPDVIITHNPEGAVHAFSRGGIPDYAWINHRDHRKTAQAVFDAIYPYSRDHAFFPEHIENGLLGHGVHSVLTADAYGTANAVAFEVGRYLAAKRTALENHVATGAFSMEDLESFMIEGQQANGWFEILGWWRGLA